jgi:DNA polymerase
VSDREELRRLVASVRGHLAIQGELGLAGLRVRWPDPPAAGWRSAGDSKLTGARPTLEQVREELGDCTRCRLCRGRTHIVFGVGSPKADLVFVGEAPGAEEDAQGEPFVGRAGQLLTRIIEAMGLRREDVYICNIIKCRPPGNRTPQPDEIASCEPFLLGQLRAIQPAFICALGGPAAQTLLKTKEGITKLRGRFFDFHGIPLMPTFHPAYLLRNPNEKKTVWQDIQLLQQEFLRRVGRPLGASPKASGRR